MAQEQPERYFYANQYDNPANWQAHYFSTGPEIVQQTGGEPDPFCRRAGHLGHADGSWRATCGNITRISSIIAVQPDRLSMGWKG